MSKKQDKGHEAEAAPEGEAGAEGEAGGKKKLPLKLIIIAGVAALVVVGGGVGAMVMLGGKKTEVAANEKGGEHGKKEKKEKKKEGEKGKEGKAGPSPISEGPDGVVFYAMPDLVVNIQAADGRPTFLKLKLSFELPDEDTAEAIEPNKPRLNDMFQTFLRELRPEDLSGSQGSYQLRMEVLRRVNLVIAPAKVNAVLVQEMLIQ